MDRQRLSGRSGQLQWISVAPLLFVSSKFLFRMYGRKQKMLLVMGKDSKPSGKIWPFFPPFNMYRFRDQKLFHINRRE